MIKAVKETLLRLILLLFGLTVAHFGVTLFLLADLGTDPFNVLVQGIYRTLDGFLNFGFLSHGNVHIVMCLLIIVALLIVDRSYIKIGTVVCMLCGGPIIDFFTFLLSGLFKNELPLLIGMLIQAIACVILAMGMTVVIKSNAGTGPNDLVAVVISDKAKWRFGIVRVAVDAVFVLVGFLLGGSVGIGTIICVVLVGPVAGFFLPISEKFVNKALKVFKV